MSSFKSYLGEQMQDPESIAEYEALESEFATTQSTTDVYQCDFCGFTGSWDETDEINGELWGCEECGKTFCSKCLREAVGEGGYMKIMQGHDLILCPKCAKEKGVS